MNSSVKDAECRKWKPLNAGGGSSGTMSLVAIIFGIFSKRYLLGRGG